MKQYRVFFTTGETITISEERYIQLIEPKNLELEKALSMIYINSNEITHIIPVSEEEKSNVVTPPSPQELRSDEEQAKQNQPVTLDDQLSMLEDKT